MSFKYSPDCVITQFKKGGIMEPCCDSFSFIGDFDWFDFDLLE